MANAASPIHLALVSDRKYFPFVLITVTSILHYHRTGNLVIHLLHPDLTDLETAPLLDMRQKVPFEVVLHKIDLEKFARDFGRSTSILWRMAIPEYIPEADRIIYLDVDLVACDDIERLWNVDMQGKSLAAVGDRVGRKVAPRFAEIVPEKYFNSGVMVWNLLRMRRENAVAKWQMVLKQHHCDLPYLDQTLLNLVYHDDLLLLHQRWNLHNSIYRNPPMEGMYTVEETVEAIRNPGIVHFTGHHKPWLFWKFTHHPYACRFWYFALQAPIPWRLKWKLRLKRLLTGRLHEPQCQRPWGRKDLKETI